MPELTIRKGLWDDFVVLAERLHKKPDALAQEVILEYVERMSDEELLEQTAAAARRAPFRIGETEEVIRQYRRRKQG